MTASFHPAVQAALAQIDRAFGGKPFPPSSIIAPAKYVAPKAPARHYVPASVRTANLGGLARFVDAAERMAAKMSPAAADACLMANAEQLNIWLGKLADADAPRHLRGLDAFDLANARDGLLAVSTEAKRVAA